MKLELVDPYSSDAERIWRDLEAASPPSYFLSWGWVKTWLALLPREHAPKLAVVTDGTPRSAFFLAQRWILRNRAMPSRALYFNVTGVPRIDQLWIEYNGLVGRDMPLGDLVRLLPRIGWDELYLPALHDRAFGDLTAGDTRILIDRRVPAYFVDLEQARAKGYLALLSGQTRSQVRRAQREAGTLVVEIARDASEAIDIYTELVALHTAQWRAKGKPGAFADPWFDRFHRRLVTERFAHGEIQLLRAKSELGTIGCLYNHVYRGRVLQYQSGMAAFESEKLKPGFVCHAAAIDHAAASGLALYDFLGGDMRYKKSLSTGSTSLVWARVQRRRIRFFLEDRVRRWRDQRRA
ncbi:MAG TPA: GNAT family N-acetyltransferase [Xanthomonadales bacterium]|nr:GNAT family N-acetyltransferase [Xanthomonadales bacterium]